MGGRGAASYSNEVTVSASMEDYSRGSVIANNLGVDEKTAAEMYDAVNAWAHGSTPIKNAQRGSGDYSSRDYEIMQTLNEFIDKSPQYTGELVRAIGVSPETKFRKNGKIYSDGSITSWTIPSNLENAKTFVRESDQLVILHIPKATHGADTRSISDIAYLDAEILQKGGYDGSLTITKVETRSEYRPGSYEKEKVRHVYLKE